jgi:hypothetical protein
MTHQALLVHRHVSQSGPRQKGDAHPPSSPGAAGARRSSVKVANLIASHYAISRKPPRHDWARSPRRARSDAPSQPPLASRPPGPASLQHHTSRHPERWRRAGTKAGPPGPLSEESRFGRGTRFTGWLIGRPAPRGERDARWPLAAPKAVGCARGDKEVTAGKGRDTCFADIAILSSERRDTIEIVPTQQRALVGSRRGQRRWSPGGCRSRRRAGA